MWPPSNVMIKQGIIAMFAAPIFGEGYANRLA